jgi:hypothetical protein
MNSRTVSAIYREREYHIPEAWIVGYCQSARARREPNQVIDAVAWWAWQTELAEWEEVGA